MMSDALEKRLIEALKSVDAHGDVAPAHVHDPMTMLLRENAIQANLMRWDDVRGRYVLTGTGRRRTVEGSRAPGTVVSFRKRGIVGSGPLHRKSANSQSQGIAVRAVASRDFARSEGAEPFVSSSSNSGRSGFNGIAAKPIVPTRNATYRRRWEMSCAAQGARVAISFEKVATRLGGCIHIDIEARG